MWPADTAGVRVGVGGVGVGVGVGGVGVGVGVGGVGVGGVGVGGHFLQRITQDQTPMGEPGHLPPSNGPPAEKSDTSEGALADKDTVQKPVPMPPQQPPAQDSTFAKKQFTSTDNDLENNVDLEKKQPFKRKPVIHFAVGFGVVVCLGVTALGCWLMYEACHGDYDYDPNAECTADNGTNYGRQCSDE